MKRFNFFKIVITFVLLFTVLTYVYYKNTQDTAISNAYIKIDELLLNYQAYRNYVSSVQKEEVYRLQSEDIVNKEYFHPELMSSTFSARGVNDLYNELRKEKGLSPITIRFASDNPRNLNNKTNSKESEILRKFNNNEITQYSEIIKKDGKDILYYVRPTKRTTAKCMRCHSDPKNAPQGLVEMYGDKNGFYEKRGEIRAILSTTYPLEYDLKLANKTFFLLVFITLFIFITLFFIVYKFTKKLDVEKEKLELLNENLDKEVDNRTNELKKEKDDIKKILDVNPSIIVITNGSDIIDANERFFEFFQYNNLEEFKKEHSCICNYFEYLDNHIFPNDKTINGVNWCVYLTKNNYENHTVSLKKDNNIYYFNLNALYLDDENILLTFQNITDIKEKETMLIQQSKMASMGEMLTNIAHQWRQPLSMISTSATSISMQKEYGVLTDDKLLKSMDNINDSAQFLSKTIEDFRNFFEKNKEIKEFKIEEVISQTLKLLEGNFKNNAIDIVLDIDNIEMKGLDSELVQVIMNILNNARDVLQEKELYDKAIQIKAIENNENTIISIHDNAGGIPEEIMEKVFDPYFTTKHQSQGTGIGLYMSYEIITKNMNGELKVSNEILDYNDISRVGAKFELTIPTLVK